MTDSVLSQKQIEVVSAMSSGASITAAAQQAGIHRNTIAYWRRNQIPFQYALAHAQYDRAMLFREKAEALIDVAITTIQEILADPKAPASVRLKAALAIVEIAANPPQPKKQLTLEIEKIETVHNLVPQTLGPPPEPSELRNDERSEVFARPVPQDVHKSAQTPIRREGPKVGRNDRCPCGSGKKYKQCCLHRTEPPCLPAAA